MIKFLEGQVEFIDRKETLRYLGYKASDVCEGEALSLIEECEREVLAVQKLRAVYGIYGIVRGQSLDLGFAKVNSRALAINLEGCDKIILFAATAGAGIDRLIVKYSRISPAKAAVIQAMGAALVEQWCDEICRIFRDEYGANKSRFSCGFGDLPLSLQRDVFAALCVTKNLGITLSDDYFMTPTKSVTAIVGIKEKK